MPSLWPQALISFLFGIIGATVAAQLFILPMMRQKKRFYQALTLIAYGGHEALEAFMREYNGLTIPPELIGSEVGDAMYSVHLLRHVAELTLLDRPARPPAPPPARPRNGRTPGA